MKFDDVNAAERAFLGAMMRDNASIAESLLIVHAEHFHNYGHRILFESARKLWLEGRTVDAVTLANDVAGKKQVEDIGGYAYLVDLWDAAPSFATVQYARAIRERAIWRGLAQAGRRITDESEHPSGSCDDALEMAEREIFAIADVGIEGASLQVAESVNLCLDRLDARKQRRSSAEAVATGFVELDQLTGGLQPGELVIMAARPSTGKTALALNLAYNAATAGKAVFFASLEQPRIDLAERMLCSEARIDGYRLRQGRMTEGDKSGILDAAERIRALPLHIDDNSTQSALRIAANVRRLKLRSDVRLAVIDYLQLVEPEDKRAPRHEQVAAVSRRLKAMAREAHLPVLCLAQLNREVEHRASGKPKLADLRDSGEIEQNADTVILLHRANDDGVVNVDVAKQRNGPTAEFSLLFEKCFMRFTNVGTFEKPLFGEAK